MKKKSCCLDNHLPGWPGCSGNSQHSFLAQQSERHKQKKMCVRLKRFPAENPVGYKLFDLEQKNSESMH